MISVPVIDLTPSPQCLHITTHPDSVELQIGMDESQWFDIEQCDNCEAYYDAKISRWCVWG